MVKNGRLITMYEWFSRQRQTRPYPVNQALKFATFFILFIVVFLNQNFGFLLNQMIIYGVLLYVFSGYAWRKLLLLSIPIVLSFLSTAFTMTMFGKGINIWWSWGIIKISEESFYYGLLLGFKTACFGFLSLTFLLTSRPILLFYALIQQFNFPPKYAYSSIAHMTFT